MKINAINKTIQKMLLESIKNCFRPNTLAWVEENVQTSLAIVRIEPRYYTENRK